MIHCRRRWWWWCVHDLRLKIIMHRCDVWTCMSAANACWIVLCKCMLDIKCSVLRGWSCAITKSFEFWLRTDEKMGLTLSYASWTPLYASIDDCLCSRTSFTRCAQFAQRVCAFINAVTVHSNIILIISTVAHIYISERGLTL